MVRVSVPDTSTTVPMTSKTSASIAVGPLIRGQDKRVEALPVTGGDPRPG